MEILGPTSNVQANEASGPKITLQGLDDAPREGVPKGWNGPYRGLLVVLAALAVQGLGCLVLFVAGLMSNDVLGMYALWIVGAAQALFVVGLLVSLSVPARDMRLIAMLTAAAWAGATAVAGLLAPEGSGWYVLAVLLVVTALGIWVLYLRGIGFRFDTATLGRDAMILWGVVIAAGVYALLLATPESRTSLVENGFFGIMITIWHAILVLQARKAIHY